MFGGSRHDCVLCAEPEAQQGGQPVPRAALYPSPALLDPLAVPESWGNRASVCMSASVRVSVAVYVLSCVYMCVRIPLNVSRCLLGTPAVP